MEYLNKKTILTTKRKQEYEIFKDSYNRYIDYCIENVLIDKNKVNKIEILDIKAVPDMSKIEIPDISKELKNMNIDLSKAANLLAGLSK